MTDNTPSLQHADFRRATALIAHNATHDIAGIRFVLDEAGALNRTTQLLLATIDGYKIIVNELRTDDAIIAIGEAIDGCATSDDVDINRAGRAIIARRDRDTDAFNTVLIEANADDRSGGVMAALLDMFGTLLPELASPYALENLSRWTARIAEFENDA